MRMKDSSYRLPEHFLEDEVRAGFYVPSIIKRAWAEGLKLLFELDRICAKYDIKYFLEYGSFLGMVRHSGFIPWDDDIDVMMHRNELEKLRKVADEELPEGMCFIDFENNDYNWKFVVCLANTNKMNFTPEYLNKHNNFPYITMIDIFVLDNIPDDETEVDEAREVIHDYLVTADLLDTDESRHIKNLALDRLTQKYGLFFPEALRGNDLELKRLLYRSCLPIMSKKNDVQTERVDLWVPNVLNHRPLFKREVFENGLRLPFENLSVMINAMYEAHLSNTGYEHIFYGSSGHNYPYFDEQRKSLGEDLDYVAHYAYEGQEIVFSAKQQWAIKAGTAIEEEYGEGTEAVAALEEYCECLYNACVGETDLDYLSQVENFAVSAITKQIKKRHIVFISCGPQAWDSFERLYKFVKEDALCLELAKGITTEIVVLRVKLYRKDVYRRLVEEVRYDDCKYPDGLKVVDIEDYDFDANIIETIYIQNPYDEYNMELSIDPNYYTKRLRDKCCYLCVYSYLNKGLKPFGADQWVQIKNMMYYVPIPGVALSDKVLVDEEKIRDRYIDYLSEWAGEDTKEIWNKKIGVFDVHVNCESIACREVLYYVTAGLMLHETGDYLIKVKETYKTLCNLYVKNFYLVHTSSIEEQVFKIAGEKTRQCWSEFWNSVDKSVLIDDSNYTLDEKRKLSHSAKAFVGFGSPYITEFRVDNKNLRIQDQTYSIYSQ